MSGPLFSTPALHGQPREVKRTFERLISEMSREGLVSNSWMVPLYDDGELVRVVAEEESASGDRDVTASGGSWDNLLTITMELEQGITYRITGTASCDMRAKNGAGSSQETLGVRVHDGTSTLHTLYGSSIADDYWTPFCVPFTLEAEAAATVTLTMDGTHYATSGSNPAVGRMRFIAVAVPILLEGVGA